MGMTRVTTMGGSEVPCMVVMTVVEKGVISGVSVNVGCSWLGSTVDVNETALGVIVAEGGVVFAHPDKTNKMTRMLRIINDNGFK